MQGPKRIKKSVLGCEHGHSWRALCSIKVSHEEDGKVTPPIAERLNDVIMLTQIARGMGGGREYRSPRRLQRGKKEDSRVSPTPAPRQIISNPGGNREAAEQ